MWLRCTCEGLLGLACRVMSMPYPPPSLLPIPTGIGHCPKPLASLELDALQLMTPEEESSNQQLFHTVCQNSLPELVW